MLQVWASGSEAFPACPGRCHMGRVWMEGDLPPPCWAPLSGRQDWGGGGVSSTPLGALTPSPESLLPTLFFLQKRWVGSAKGRGHPSDPLNRRKQAWESSGKFSLMDGGRAKGGPTSVQVRAFGSSPEIAAEPPPPAETPFPSPPHSPAVNSLLAWLSPGVSAACAAGDGEPLCRPVARTRGLGPQSGASLPLAPGVPGHPNAGERGPIPCPETYHAGGRSPEAAAAGAAAAAPRGP